MREAFATEILNQIIYSWMCQMALKSRSLISAYLVGSTKSTKSSESTVICGLELALCCILHRKSLIAADTMKRVSYMLSTVDIWAIGIILYQMLSGRLPFHCETQMENIEMIQSESY